MTLAPGAIAGELKENGIEREDTLLRRNLRFCITEGLVAMPIIFLTLPANFIVSNLLTQTFGLRVSMFGLIVSLPAWCNVAQMVVIPVCGRYWSQKTITLVFSWFHLAVWIGLGFALPFIPKGDVVTAGRFFFIIFALSSFSQAMVGVAWTSWVQEWIPERVRGKVFGRRNRALQIATVVFLLLGGRLLTSLQDTDPVLGFQLVVAVAIFLRMLSILFQQKILGSAGYHSEERSINLRSQLRAVRKAPSLLTFIGFGAGFGFAANFLGPFFSIFLYEGLGLSIAQVSRFVVTAGITGAASLPAWGQLYDRYGCRPVMMFVLFPWMLIGSFWAAVGPDNTWVLFIIFGSGGLFGAGFLLGSFNLLLKLIPREAKTIAISLNVALASLAAAIAPILGGSLLDLAWDLGFDRIRTYHAAAIVHYSLLLSTVLILARVVEPKSSSVSQVIGAMRSYRQVGALVGLSFLLNYTFVKKRRKRRNRSVSSRNPEPTDPAK